MKALELADAAETIMRPGGLADEVAAELRRLAKVNAELLEALEYAVETIEPHIGEYGQMAIFVGFARAVITKAKEQQ